MTEATRSATSHPVAVILTSCGSEPMIDAVRESDKCSLLMCHEGEEMRR